MRDSSPIESGPAPSPPGISLPLACSQKVLSSPTLAGESSHSTPATHLWPLDHSIWIQKMDSHTGQKSWEDNVMLFISKERWLIDRVDARNALSNLRQSQSAQRALRQMQDASGSLLDDPVIYSITDEQDEVVRGWRGPQIRRRYAGQAGRRMLSLSQYLTTTVWLNPMRLLRGMYEEPFPGDPPRASGSLEASRNRDDNVLPLAQLLNLNFQDAQESQFEILEKILRGQQRRFRKVVQAILDVRRPRLDPFRLTHLEIAYDLPVNNVMSFLAFVGKRAQSTYDGVQIDKRKWGVRIRWKGAKDEEFVVYRKTANIVRFEIRLLSPYAIKKAAGSNITAENLRVAIPDVVSHHFPVFGDLFAEDSALVVDGPIWERAPNWSWLGRAFDDVFAPFLSSGRRRTLRKVLETLHDEGRISMRELRDVKGAQDVVRKLFKAGVLQRTRKRGNYALKSSKRYLQWGWPLTFIQKRSR